jgi:hypothetical protein
LVAELRVRDVPYVIITGFYALPSNMDEGAAARFQKPIDTPSLVDFLSSLADTVTNKDA